MLRDKRLYGAFEDKLREQAESDVPARPDIVGYSREVAEMHKMNITMTHMLRVIARNYSIPFPLGPLFPGEMFSIEKAAEDLADLDADIASSMKTTAVQRKSRKPRKEAHA